LWASNGSHTDWAQLDDLARRASLRGVTLIPVLIGLPGGVSYDAPKTSRRAKTWPPSPRAPFTTFG
jgi:hypothetical protein